jgi:hypothetical protein
MKKTYSLWLKVAIALQFITGVFHLLGFINSPVPKNDSERQLFDLMTNYKFDLGAGFLRSMEDLMNSFSIAFALFLFFSCILNLFLLRNNLPNKVMNGVILINFFAYLICFIAMSALTFLPPIICTGLIVVMLLIAYLRLKAESSKK